MYLRVTAAVVVSTVLFTMSCSAHPEHDIDSTLFDPLSDEFIEYINSVQTKWKAGRNFHKNTSMKFIEGLMGVKKPDHRLDEVIKHQLGDEMIIDAFDSRYHWPYCPSLREIRDQGSCGSCWAVSAVATMTDRHCIHSGGERHFHYSAEDLLSCSGVGSCAGGLGRDAWIYWVNHGIVSGGPYGSQQGCYPYEVPPCAHYNVHRPRPPCQESFVTPYCKAKCQPLYNLEYEEDKYYGKQVYSVEGVRNIQIEIMRNGPVQTHYTVYTDFLHYKSGVYRHTSGNFVSGHAVKILGWGEENGEPYWLIANSWNYDWGDHGYFKILRGTNECGIEEFVSAGIPKYQYFENE